MKSGKTAVTLLLSAVLSLCTLSAPASAAGYGQGKLLDAQNRPEGAVQFQQEFSRYGACSMSSDPTRIILTFDQGYENGYTAQILDTLAEKHASAIFFLTGDYAKKEQQLVRRMIAEGHMLGNHGMKHRKLPELKEPEIREEIGSLHDYVLSQYGFEMKYFRPPCGEYDEDSLRAVQNMGYKTVFWSFAYVDWKPDAQPEPEAALQTLTDAAHGGAVYLLHSVSCTNAVILGRLIDNLRAKGYTV